MLVRFYTLEKRTAPGDARSHFWLVSFESDVLSLEVDTPAQVARSVHATKDLPYILFTMESDPEWGFSMPNRFVKYRTKHRALVLWSRGKVLELPGTRTID